MHVVKAGAEFNRVASDALTAGVKSLLCTQPRVSMALSGGRTPWNVFHHLGTAALDWDRVDIYQVDERVAPSGSAVRNLVGLQDTLGPNAAARLSPMPVGAPDLGAAAKEYAASLPDTLDIVHLGLGDDGHTASLIPGDPVLEITDARVALTGVYRGHRRMTLTLPTLNAAQEIVWLVEGARKADMVRRLREADPSIPAGRVRQDRATLILGEGLEA